MTELESRWARQLEEVLRTPYGRLFPPESIRRDFDYGEDVHPADLAQYVARQLGYHDLADEPELEELFLWLVPALEHARASTAVPEALREMVARATDLNIDDDNMVRIARTFRFNRRSFPARSCIGDFARIVRRALNGDLVERVLHAGNASRSNRRSRDPEADAERRRRRQTDRNLGAR